MKSLFNVCSLAIIRNYDIDKMLLPRSIKNYLRLLHSIEESTNMTMDIYDSKLANYFNFKLVHRNKCRYISRTPVLDKVLLDNINLFVLMMKLGQEDICIQLVDFIDCGSIYNGDTLLMHACTFNMDRLVEILLDKCPVNYINRSGETALINAAACLESRKVFNKILSKDCLPLHRDIHDHSAIVTAGFMHNWPRVKEMLKIEHDIRSISQLFVDASFHSRSTAIIIMNKYPAVLDHDNSICAFYRLNYYDLLLKALKINPRLNRKMIYRWVREFDKEKLNNISRLSHKIAAINMRKRRYDKLKLRYILRTPIRGLK